MNYIRNIQRGVNYIHDNIKDDINLDEISKQSYMSQSYFFKIFRIVTGYSVKRYITLYRLHLAAQDLLATKKRLIDITFEYGFNSQQTFTKAFCKCYGIPPRAFQLSRNVCKPFDKITLDYQGGAIMKESFENVRFIIKEEMLTIGITTEVDYNDTGNSPIRSLWDKWITEEIYKDIPNPINYPETLGITSEESKEDTATYCISMEVSNLDLIPDGMVGKTFPRTTYAVFKTTLKEVKSGSFWKYFYYNWLPESGYEQPGSLLTQNGMQITNKPQFELYQNYMSDESDEIEIYAPIII